MTKLRSGTSNLNRMPSKPEHSFLEARAAYHEQRKHQRQLIATALTSAGFKVTNGHRAGKGVENYVSGGELSRPYDLSNWLWVKGTRDGLRVTVTLQVLDQDPKSKNIHALIDRIGIKVAVDEPTKRSGTRRRTARPRRTRCSRARGRNSNFHSATATL